jgi:phosphoglycolate phosphatase-like HAD superfamily hydrolase
MNRLAIFDIDGTLTDTNGVDDECYRAAVAEALGVPERDIDWSGAAHVTDAGILDFLCTVHRRSSPTPDDLARARTGFITRLTESLERFPTRFVPIPGAPDALPYLATTGWRVAFATGGWGPSARMKLSAAGIPFDEAVLACADDALTRAEIVQLARARAERVYQCQFGRVVSLGDGSWDVQTAAALQLPFVGIGGGERANRLRACGATTVLPDYANLGAFMAAIESATPPRSTA